MRRISNKKTELAATVAAIMLVIAQAGYAGTYKWDGSDTSVWTTGTNWTNNAAPGSTDDVVIDGGYVNAPTLDLSGGAVTIKSLSLGANNASTLTLSNGDASSKKLIITGNCTIGPNGTSTHTANGSSETHKLNLEVQGTLTVSSGGKMDVDGKGYAVGQGPGKGTTHYGGSYGGEGGPANVGSPGPAYGSVTQPTSLGSGGGLTGGRGGGAIILNVSGNTTNNGTITAEGADASAGSGGAGGSVRLTTSTLSGDGTISVNGGDGAGSYRSGGGGGRTAVILTSGNDFGNVTNTAYGGSPASGGSYGAAGTIYFKKVSDTNGTLIVDNNSHTARYQTKTAETEIPTNQTWQFDTIIITNRGAMGVGENANAVLNLTNGILRTDSNSRLVVSDDAIVFPATYTLTNATISQKGTNSLTFDTTLIIADSGVLTHESNYDTDENKLSVTITGDLTVQPGGSVSAVSKGYGTGQGSGAGDNNAGGSHGGEGGDANVGSSGPTYGSIVQPTTLGSGGGHGSGGGSIVLNVAGNTTMNGSITADAGQAPNGNATGAGGSVWLTTTTLSGNGTISADGGPVTNTAGMYYTTGGGGHIAIALTSGNDFGNVTNRAYGGYPKGDNGYNYGAPGTIYLQKASQASGHGDVIMENNGYSTTSITDLSPFSTNESQYATITITNTTKSKLTRDNAWVGDLFVYTNCFLTLTNFTLHVNSAEHYLDSAEKGPGATNRVDNYDQIVWHPPPPSGTIFIIR